jgi:hypothetical protein
LGGTGSKPPSQNGLQRPTRFNAIQLPFRAPCVWMASIAYCEQVGSKRQLGGKNGLMKI